MEVPRLPRSNLKVCTIFQFHFASLLLPPSPSFNIATRFRQFQIPQTPLFHNTTHNITLLRIGQIANQNTKIGDLSRASAKVKSEIPGRSTQAQKEAEKWGSEAGAKLDSAVRLPSLPFWPTTSMHPPPIIYSFSHSHPQK